MVELSVPAHDPASYFDSSCGTTLKGDSCAASLKGNDVEAAYLPTLSSSKAVKTYRFANLRSHDFFHTFVCGFSEFDTE